MKPLYSIAPALAVLFLGASPAAPQTVPAPYQSSPAPNAPAPNAPAPNAPVPSAADLPVILLIDLSSGQTLYAREADRLIIPASVAKVMTAYSVFRLFEEGALSPSTQFEISRQLDKEWSGKGSTMFLRAGERPTVGQLLLGATTISGNDASMALADAGGGSLAGWSAIMNRNAAELGMADSNFESPNGYPDGGRTFTTARDLAILGEAITTRFPDYYRRFFGHREMTWRGLTQQNHDPISGQVDGADGLKTGFTSEAGFTFLGSAQRGNRRLVMVLAGSATSQIRDETARRLIEWGFAGFESRVILPAGLSIGQALVQNGAAGTVGLRTDQAVLASLPRAVSSAPRLSIRYRGPIMAPVAEGDQIASLVLEVEGMAPAEVPLFAAQSVDRANFVRRIFNSLTGIFA